MTPSCWIASRRSAGSVSDFASASSRSRSPETMKACSTARFTSCAVDAA